VTKLNQQTSDSDLLVFRAIDHGNSTFQPGNVRAWWIERNNAASYL